jgi:hypothetical protein
MAGSYNTTGYRNGDGVPGRSGADCGNADHLDFDGRDVQRLLGRHHDRFAQTVAAGARRFHRDQ